MPQIPYIDSRGNLVPITNGDLMFPSRPTYVAHYGSIYTYLLVREAKRQNIDLELFLELHRRATERFLRDGTFFKWNRGEGSGWDHFSNARLIGEYDEKWGVKRRRGLNYLLPDG